VARLRQGCASLETQRYFLTELERISTDCTGTARSAWASQSHKRRGFLLWLPAPGQDLAGLRKSAKRSVIPHSGHPSHTGSANAKDVPASCRSLYFLSSSRWSLIPVPKHALTSTGRPLHRMVSGERVFLQRGLSKFQSSKGPRNEQLQFSVKTALPFLHHLKLLRTFPKAMFTKKDHLTYS